MRKQFLPVLITISAFQFVFINPAFSQTYSFQSYTVADGLPQSTVSAILQDSKGYMWFGTTAGVSKYNQQLRKRVLIRPPVYITGVSLLENDSAIRYVSELKHSENYLRFDYAGICFTAPEALIYYYKLKGFDTHWQEPALRTVEYTHLPGGHYTFKAKAKNKDGIWSEAPAEFSSVITPAFWNTWWFTILAVVLLVVIILGVFKEWSASELAIQLKNQNVKLKNTLEQLNQEISERKRAEEALMAEHSKLQTWLKHESLLAEIASSLNSADSFQDIMGELIARIGKTMGVDSAGFYRFDVNYETTIRLDTWNSYSGQQKLVFPRMIHCSKISNFCQQLKANESVILSNVSELEVKEKNFLANLDFKALIICPLSIVNQLKGFVYFAYQHEHIWSPEEINIYKTIANMIASAWERDSQFHARLEAEKKHTETIQLAEKTWRLASIGVMAAGITHEINQPLTIIKVTADSMILWDEDNKGVLPGKFRKSLVRISDNVTRIDRIIRQMRFFSESPDKIALENIDLNVSVKNAVSLISRQLLSHGIDLQFDLEDASLPIQGNRIHLEQIVINLVTNAIQALDTCKNKDKIIKIASSRVKKSAILKVEDNGPGFSEEVGNKIFDPFFSTKRSTGGTGLGLAIVKNFVYGFGGFIRAKNNKTSGTTFIVRFPISRST